MRKNWLFNFSIIVSVVMIVVSLSFLLNSLFTGSMNLQYLTERIISILFFVGLILYLNIYKNWNIYKNRKTIHFGCFFMIICFLISLINIFAWKEIRISNIVFILCLAYMIYSIIKDLYFINDVLLLKILTIILFFNNKIKYKLAWIYFEDKKYHMAINILKNSRNVKLLYFLATIYEDTRDYNMAIIIYTKILCKDKNERPDILYNRGAIYENIGKSNESIIDFTNCIKCKKPDPKAFIALGSIKDKMGKYEEAEKLFKKGKEIDNSLEVYIPKKYNK